MIAEPKVEGDGNALTAVYRTASLTMAVIFAAVGLLFLLFSDGVLAFFNRVSDAIGFPGGPEHAVGFYLGLAVGYMYLVTVIAFMMWRHPRERILPFLLTNGKAATAILSAGLFIFQQPLLIYATNAIIDGAIAVGVFILHRSFMGRVK
ncbi:MAG: hypothetical protein IT282_05125 [Bacteroidetes bacterium]|nr:hypothetical protein [Bacteroidota bacterium]